MENDFLQLRQIPGTEHALTDYLKPLNIQEDTVYALMYIPAACPRCEAAFSVFYDLLKEKSPTNKMILISAFDDSTAAKKYNLLKKYRADYYLYDTKETYKHIFSMNTGDLFSTYVMKISQSDGVLVTGGQFTQLNKTFVNQLVNHATRLAPYHYATSPADENTSLCKTVLPFNKLHPDRQIPLSIPDNDTLFISRLFEYPRFENGLFFNDDLSGGIMLFEETDNQLAFKDIIRANEKEKDMFIKIPADILQRQKEQSQVFYIPLSANFHGPDELGISYSLPNMSLEESEEENVVAIAYYNGPAIIRRNARTLQPLSPITPDFDIANSRYFHKHFNYTFFNNKIWMECVKLTWPMEFDKEDYANDIERNSFDDRFYDTFNPTLAAFDARTGKITGYYGHLEECQRISKTGYLFLQDVYADCGSDFLYGNGFTGTLYVADSTQIGKNERKYSAFEIAHSDIPLPDSTLFYKQEYRQPYEKTFYRKITTVKMNHEEIHCLVRYGNSKEPATHDYAYVIIDRATGQRRKYSFPKLDATSLLGFGLQTKKEQIAPFILYKKDERYAVMTYMR